MDGLTVRPEALPHPTLSEVYTLGHCLTERYPSDWGGPDTIRSIVVLYHGSFRALAALDPDFDWEEELWETLTHEVRHHLETLAREDELERLDYAVDEALKRDQGEAFDPLYYRYGREAAPGIYQVEYDFFLEQEWDEDDFEKAPWIEFSWHGNRWRIPRPETLGDLHYVWVWGVDVGPGTLQLVLVRKRGWRRLLREWRRREEPELWESEAEAEPLLGGTESSPQG